MSRSSSIKFGFGWEIYIIPFLVIAMALIAIYSSLTTPVYEYDYLVVNDDFEEAFCQLKSIIIANRMKTTRQTAVLENLLHNLLENP